MLATALRQAGHEILEADDGRPRLKIADCVAVDLIITDLVMPELDGIATIMTVREQYPNLPVIAISGTSTYSPVYLKVAKVLGARRFLEKLITLEALLVAVNELLPNS